MIIAEIRMNEEETTAEKTAQQISKSTRTRTPTPRNATIRIANATKRMNDANKKVKAEKQHQQQTAAAYATSYYRLDYTDANNNSTKQTDLLWEWRKKRVNRTIYNNFFRNGIGTGLLKKNADRHGPVLDFVIAGFPKCGTTAMMRTLSSVTTMPSAMDVRTPIRKVVWYSYQSWPIEYGGNGKAVTGEDDNADADDAALWTYNKEKPLKGTKCPYYLESPDLNDIAEQLPKANLIVGIRHPVLWFQSFANMVRNMRNVRNA